MRADREQELKQQFICRRAFSVLDTPILPADLAELAGPVGQQQRMAAVAQRCILSAFRPAVARACKPSPRELVVTRYVVAERVLTASGLLAAAPQHLGAAEERVVNRALQRPPANGGINAPQVRHEAPLIDLVYDPGRVVPS